MLLRGTRYAALGSGAYDLRWLIGRLDQYAIVEHAFVFESEYMTEATGILQCTPIKGALTLDQSTGGYQPTVAATPSGRGCADFDGIDQHMSLTSISVGTGHRYGVVMVAQFDDVTTVNVQDLVRAGDASNNDTLEIRLQSTHHLARVAGTDNAISDSWNDNGWHFFALDQDSVGNHRFYQDHRQQSLSTSGTNPYAIDYLSIGAEADPTFATNTAFDGKIAFLATLNTSAGAAAVASLRGDLRRYYSELP